MNEPADAQDPTPEMAGARVTPAGVYYRVWAPDQREMFVSIERRNGPIRILLRPESDGYWTGSDAGGHAGDLYRFGRADGRLLPDVASRFQPTGVHGPSECIDSSSYDWRCSAWKRPAWTGQTLYEVHIGTLTPEGTFRAAIGVLDHVRDLGAEAIEIMPVADFAGNRNWGYDGVALYAPTRCYGRPDDLRALVDAAHERGLAVILDVVYNHLGPAGNYLAEYAADYFHPTAVTPWGRALNLHGERSRPVRDFLVANAAYWLDEFRFDGLRLDATHAMPDRSLRHILGEIAVAVHHRGGFVIAEDERNDAQILRLPNGSGYGLDALWADDFHHQVRVALTGTQAGYYAGYTGSPAALAETLNHGWMYRGQSYHPWDGRARGTPCDHLPASAFIICLENHDQIGNRPDGQRLEQLVTARQFRAVSLLLCLSPYAPLLFMGQEWAADSPFLFFTDHGGELGTQISAGRRREFERQGAGWNVGEFLDPEAPEAFSQSKLRWPERDAPAHAGILALYRECLAQRRAVLVGPALHRSCWQVYHKGALVAVRYRVAGGEHLLLVAVPEERIQLDPLPAELQPTPGESWTVVIDSEASRFGGANHLPSHRLDGLAGPGALWLKATAEGAHHGAA